MSSEAVRPIFTAMSRTMKALLGVWIAALAAAAGWIAWDVVRGDERQTIGGPFALTDQDGRTVTSDSLKGKPTLIYFGFTFCPDVCPTSLLLMETAVERLGPDAAKKVNLVFITIDPERDTPALLKGYVTNFGPTYIGLTGTPQQIADVARAYRVYYQKVPGKDGGPYLMDHSSIVYLLDRNGRFVTHFTHDAKAEQIANTVGRLL
ncbi:SCO family protein [Reyranella sp.]|uniref:SCO family protein n=1 Tax=Reyranella sp. TaxID=1929291 RepID=UPI000B0F85C7|nr:SCO family protein [Reyranella sp.]